MRLIKIPWLLTDHKPVPGEKTSWSKDENQQKLNPNMTPSPGIEHRPHWWEASTLTTAPSLLPQWDCKFGKKQQQQQKHRSIWSWKFPGFQSKNFGLIVQRRSTHIADLQKEGLTFHYITAPLHTQKTKNTLRALPTRSTCYLINFTVVKQVLHDQHVLPHGSACLWVLVTDSINAQDLCQQSRPLLRKQWKRLTCVTCKMSSLTFTDVSRCLSSISQYFRKLTKMQQISPMNDRYMVIWVKRLPVTW